MESSSAKITILFEDPLWIGLYERQEGDRYTVCKITFCAEPKNYAVYAFLMHNFSRLQF
ncbi:YjdF family protein [Yeguia hominis]|uniref:YjdF family protein n=1 Tax=Yeguia hominis TaxID=2763662 RepID=UPI0024B58393|nr:YjdF family protein [Yeguia hominis]